MAKKKETVEDAEVSKEPVKEEAAKTEKKPKAEKKAKEPKPEAKEKAPKEKKASKKEKAPEELEAKEEIEEPAEEEVEIKAEEPKPAEEPRKVGKKGIVYIYSSSNNTIVHITDVTGADTIARVSGGMVTKQDRLKGAPFQAMLAAGKAIDAAVAQGYTDVDILVRAPGGHKDMEIGKGAEQAIKAFSKSKLKIGVVEDLTPIIHGHMKRKGGRRGRRL